MADRKLYRTNQQIPTGSLTIERFVYTRRFVFAKVTKIFLKGTI